MFLNEPQRRRQEEEEEEKESGQLISASRRGYLRGTPRRLSSMTHLLFPHPASCSRSRTTPPHPPPLPEPPEPSAFQPAEEKTVAAASSQGAFSSVSLRARAYLCNRLCVRGGGGWKRGPKMCKGAAQSRTPGYQRHLVSRH